MDFIAEVNRIRPFFVCFPERAARNWATKLSWPRYCWYNLIMGIFNACLYDRNYNEAKNGPYAWHIKRIFFSCHWGWFISSNFSSSISMALSTKWNEKTNSDWCLSNKKQQAQKQSNIVLSTIPVANIAWLCCGQMESNLIKRLLVATHWATWCGPRNHVASTFHTEAKIYIHIQYVLQYYFMASDNVKAGKMQEKAPSAAARAAERICHLARRQRLLRSPGR